MANTNDAARFDVATESRLVSLVARCTSTGCPFAVWAQYDSNGGCCIDLPRCFWTHDHPPPCTAAVRLHLSEHQRVRNLLFKAMARAKATEKAEQATEQQSKEVRVETNYRPLQLQCKIAIREGLIGWEPRWTARTTSPALLKLLEKRDEVFALQRRLHNTTMQHDSWNACAKRFASDYSIPRQSFIAFYRFCHLVRIPLFPIKPALIAIVVYSKYSAKEGRCKILATKLERLQYWTASCWEPLGTEGEDEESGTVYRALVELDEGGEALKQFLAELEARDQKDIDAADEGLVPKMNTPRRTCTAIRVTHDDAESVLSSLSSGEVSNGASSDAEPSPRLPASSARSGIAAFTNPDDVEQLDCSLPFSTTFPSLHALWLDCVCAIVPIYGVSVQITLDTAKTGSIACNRYHSNYSTKPGGKCSFRLVARCEEEGEWLIVADQSELRHNHGRDPRLGEDSEWRPRFQNAKAKAAMAEADKRRKKGKGREEVAVGKGKRKQEESVNETPSKKKKSRKAPPSRTVIVISSSPEPPPRRSPPPSQPITSTSSILSNIGASTSKQLSLPSTSSSRPRTAISPAAAQSPSLQSCSASSSTSAAARPLLQPSAPHPFLTSLTAFLTTLDPLLPSLAPDLFAALFDSPDVDLSTVDPNDQDHNKLQYQFLFPTEYGLRGMFDALRERRGGGVGGEDERVGLLARRSEEFRKEVGV